VSAVVRLGVLGGTFDPVHRGHLRMARAAEVACGLSRIYFVPAAHPWHKAVPTASYADRYAMVALALLRSPRWMPLDLGAASATYAVDQIRHLRRLYPGSRLFFIVGADAMATLPSWKQPQALLRLCDIIVLARAGFSLGDMIAALPPRLRPAPDRGPRPRAQINAQSNAHPTQRGEPQDAAAVQVVKLAGGSHLYWLARFQDPFSSTQARQWLAAPASPNSGRPPLPAAVAAYARRAHLYCHA